MPELLAAGMLDKFATAKAGGGGGVRYHRDKRQHQLVGTYAAVLLLHLDSFAFDANAYAAELKLSQKDCTARLRELGCTVERRRKDGESRATARLRHRLRSPKSNGALRQNDPTGGLKVSSNSILDFPINY